MIARGLALNGCKVYICGRKGSDLADASLAVNKECCASPTKTGAGGGSLEPLQCDLQSLPACRDLASAISSREEKLHILVHNSGASWGDELESYPDSAWTKLLTLNLQRVFTVTQLLLPLLKKAGAGEGEASARGNGSSGGGTSLDPARIIHIGSIDALRVPTLSNFAYSASKAGLHHLSRTLAVKLGPENITSNVIACGPFETNMMKATLESLRDVIEDGNPLGRIGTQEDVAGTVLWLVGRGG
ncbi:hypothetical protein MKZ38_002112 [Zalerion maritima]|uniref:Uncharacterized protein n=1 Tax=Zalerion maritima TaxID=339359 RepID=A0AAD5RPJ2_9PEZI|nr:hypothetical protein MKZ38_002112 [Zalerion maritima]